MLRQGAGFMIACNSMNSWIPYCPCSRPTPDCLKPPKGAAGSLVPLIFTMPVRIRRATRWALSVSRDHTPPDRPYRVSLAMCTASSSSS